MIRRCIFCKSDSTSSKSVEHIVPESLGNTDHTLPPGVVCDACNNYFSRKVEKPFLDSPSISHLRFHEAIPNKRGRIPPTSGFLLPYFPVALYRERDAESTLCIELPDQAVRSILEKPYGTIVVPHEFRAPEDQLVARLLAKMAVEALAHRLIRQTGGLDYLVDEKQLDPIRCFARRGIPRMWPHHRRRIYEAGCLHRDTDGTCYQTLHEFDFLQTPTGEWYFVFAVFGTELTINLGGPEIEGYLKWLEEHNGVSPLYHGRNAPVAL